MLLLAWAVPATGVPPEVPDIGPVTVLDPYLVFHPTAHSEPENVPEVRQPVASQLPYFDPYLGWFPNPYSGIGDGFALYTDRDPDGSLTRPVYVAVGAISDEESRVYVGAGRIGRVKMYDAVTLQPKGEFWPPQGAIWGSEVSVAFWRGEVFVKGKSQGIYVFDPEGNFKRKLPEPTPQFYQATLGSVHGATAIDVAWGEIWMTQGGNGSSGSEVIVLDAKTGGMKGIGYNPPISAGGGPPLSYAKSSWRDLAVMPEYSGAIVHHRFFSRNPLAQTLALPGSPECLPNTTTCPPSHQRGIDAPWGMRWFLEVHDSRTNLGSLKASTSIREHSAERRPPIFGVDIGSLAESLGLHPPPSYLVQRRSWTPQQTQDVIQFTGTRTNPSWGDPINSSVSDIAYHSREVRIDTYGQLTTSNWLKGTKCLRYVVSEADIYVVGERGERWYELARGFDRIELWIDGVKRQEKVGAQHVKGEFCENTANYQSRPSSNLNAPEGERTPHKLELKAYVDGGKEVKKTHPELRLDNDSPRGEIEGVGPHSRATVKVSGTIADDHSGGREWILELQRPGQSSWETLCTRTAPDATGRFSCSWNTTAYDDGDGYKLRARLRDKSSDDAQLFPTETTADDGNLGYSTTIPTMVDNTPPDFSHPAPAVGSGYGQAFNRFVSPLFFRQTDTGSGIDRTTLEFNTARDGSANGAWKQADSTPATDSGNARTLVNVRELAPGLYRYRATTTDRAGNQRVSYFQTVRPHRECPVPPTRAGEQIRRCYAGIAVGELWRNPLLPYDNWVGKAIRASVKPPAQASTASGFSYLGTSLTGLDRGAATLEGGPTDDCAAPNAVNPGNVPTGRWTAVGQRSYLSNREDHCFEIVWEKGRVEPPLHWRYEVALRQDGYAVLSLNGGVRLQAGPHNDSNENYWFGAVGGFLNFQGETTHWSRYLVGHYSKARWRRYSTSGWLPPGREAGVDFGELDTYTEEGDPSRYQTHFNKDRPDNDYFCVEGLKNKCHPPGP